jgi:membrane-bound serine protease (ClpP class)
VQGGVVVLDTTDLRHRVVELNAFERVLAFVSDPTITFLLLSFGGLAIVTELLHFGAVFPGVIGVTMLVLGFAGVGQLPFSWAGVALIVLAMALFFAEAQAPGIGFFGVTGAIALVLGGLFLVGFFGAPALPGSPELRVNRAVVVVMGAIAGAAMLSLAWQLRRARIPGYTSAVQREALIGEVATVTTRLDPTGAVHVAGEHWEARLPEGSVAETGTEVRVVDVVGLVLEVAATSVAAPAPGGGDTPDVAPA